MVRVNKSIFINPQRNCKTFLKISRVFRAEDFFLLFTLKIVSKLHLLVQPKTNSLLQAHTCQNLCRSRIYYGFHFLLSSMSSLEINESSKLRYFFHTQKMKFEMEKSIIEWLVQYILFITAIQKM